MKQQNIQSNPLVPGPLVLARRDQLEAALTLRFPAIFQPAVSIALTTITGLAPSRTGLPARPRTTEQWEFLKMIAAVGAGATEVLSGDPVAATAGGVTLVHGMRQFSTVVGHRLIQGPTVLNVSPAVRCLIYDVISAALLLPGVETYQKNDQRFTASLEARVDGRCRLEPRFHLKFLAVRFAAVFGEGPLWRRLFAVALYSAIIAWAPLAGLIAWLLFAGLGFQVATLEQ